MDPGSLVAAVESKVGDLQARLLAKVEANLSGDVLRTRSGALKASIGTALDIAADTCAASVTSSDIPYAAIHEYGGRTPPHDIVPVKAVALSFAGASGGPVFARRVHHPGSLIPARAPFGRVLKDLRTEISDGLKQAVRDALGAT